MTSAQPSRAKPIMQGCRDTIPTLRHRMAYYCSEEQILKMVKDGDVALLKGSWLLEWCHTGRALPRRQDLEASQPSAFYSFDESMSRNNQNYVSISHCWYTLAHPDLDGLQVKEIEPALAARLRGCRGRKDMATDVAIFWCWCSFFQAPRSQHEQEAFERSMQHMDL